MPKARNSYGKGLNQDTSRSKRDPSSYYDALNLKVVTNAGLSTGSLENERGNLLTFGVPDIPAQIYNHTDGTSTSIPIQTGLNIIGWCTVDKYVVIFTTNQTGASPTGSAGQVWKFEYDETTNTILNIVGTAANPLLDWTTGPNSHLVFNGLLDFSSFHRIEAEGRFENNATMRVYFTDFNSPLRAVDVIDPAVLNLKADLIDLNPAVTFTLPIVKSIGIGNLEHTSKVQYAYRLISAQGSQSVVSPASGLVSLLEVDASGERYYVDIEGTAPGIGTSKSVTFIVKGIDEDYSIIEHIAILYTTKDAPQIFKFGENTVPIGGEVEVTLDGNEARINLTNAEYSLISAGFQKCKTIDAKDNILIAGNIVSVAPEITTAQWDSRAYRFNSSGIARLDDANGQLPLSAPNPAWSSIPDEDFDAICPYNDELAPGWATTLQYKYQVNGTTLGGQGQNISYTFVDEDMMVDNALGGATQFRRTPPHIKSTRNPTGTTKNLGVKYPDGTSVIHDLSGEFPNFSSPLTEAVFTGYARGEVYRFGIEFYKNKGEVTYVNWIADIKFPEPVDGFPIGNSASTDSGDMYTKSLGIRFTVDVSAIASDISGYRIVRAERDTNNVTRLGTGTIMIVDRIKAQDDFGTGKRKNTLYEARAEEINGVQVEVGVSEINVNGSDRNNRYHLPDQPGLNRVYEGNFTNGHYEFEGAHLQYASTIQNTIFLSPLMQFRDPLFFKQQAGDYIKTLGYYQSKAAQCRFNGGSNDEMIYQQWVWINRVFENTPHQEQFKVEEIKYLEGGEHLEGSQLPSSISNGGDDYINASYGKTNSTNDKGFPFGIGDNTPFMVLDNVPGTGFTPASAMQWKDNLREGYYTLTVNQQITRQVHRFKEVVYVRPLTNQYGGNSFEAISKTEYMSTGHFQPITTSVPNSLNFTVYGGDVTTSYFDQEYIQPYIDQVEQKAEVFDTPGNRNMGIAVLIPTENRINIEYQWGRHWAKDRDNDDVDDYVGETFTHHELYLQQNNGEGKFFAKDFAISTANDYPHRLWASETKIDGELVDSWRRFKASNILDVEGSYGPINKVINFQDKLFYYQDRAFGVASINERSILSDTNGIDLTLGTGEVLDDFRYVSTTTGAFHQHAVIASSNSLYHYDVNLRKMYKFSGQGASPLSDLKGLSSFFANNVDNAIVDTDITLRDASLGGGVGVHGTFDHRHNRMLMTFLNPKNNVNDFTIGYSEFLDGYESFYSYTPGLYLETGRRLLSNDPASPGNAYLHDAGTYGTFYNNVPSDTEITLLVSPEGDIPKIFTNIEYNSEVSLAGIQQPLDTLNQLECWNDYQTTGVIPLIVGANVKRRMRHWRHTINRDSTSLNQRARMRDYSVFLKLTYSNNNDKRLVLHDVIISYTPARD
mgnify:CR=1 FL=1|tara:strand:- start:3443 stop:7621 length:4179 start_codon:yes stop_codon:yes gene_type:complete